LRVKDTSNVGKAERVLAYTLKPNPIGQSYDSISQPIAEVLYHALRGAIALQEQNFSHREEAEKKKQAKKKKATDKKKDCVVDMKEIKQLQIRLIEQKYEQNKNLTSVKDHPDIGDL
jgi:hypothetical protein